MDSSFPNKIEVNVRNLREKKTPVKMTQKNLSLKNRDCSWDFVHVSVTQYDLQSHWVQGTHSPSRCSLCPKFNETKIIDCPFNHLGCWLPFSSWFTGENRSTCINIAIYLRFAVIGEGKRHPKQWAFQFSNAMWRVYQALVFLDLLVRRLEKITKICSKWWVFHGNFHRMVEFVKDHRKKTKTYATSVT